MTYWITPLRLTGNFVTLAPLTMAHAEDLKEAVLDGDLHKLWYTPVPAPEAMEAEITRRLGLQDEGKMIAFATCTPDGKAVGMTTYMNIDPVNKRFEIGHTWMRKAVQRGPVNTEAKLMMLRHAFDTLKANAVEFRTHSLNLQSRRAIERLGAQLDGILRRHVIQPNGTIRDTVVYSIISPDWPTIEAHLTWKLEIAR